MIFIQGDTITTYISTTQYFTSEYYDKYIKNFTKSKDIISKNEPKISYQSEPLIYITKIEYLNEFYTKIIPSLNTKFVLITHYGDAESGKYNKILNHPLLIKWYGQNMSIISNKSEGIPLGLENQYWGRTNIEIIKQYSNNSKNKLLYINFSLKTNPNRPIIMSNLLQKGFLENKKLPWDQYIEDLSNYKFCISPKGSGIDCHRHWECLYLGVIPIVEKSIHMSFFDDLPILFVDNYDIISIEYLNQVYSEFILKKFNLEKLDTYYWDKKIKEHF